MWFQETGLCDIINKTDCTLVKGDIKCLGRKNQEVCQVVEATEGEVEWSQSAELKAIQLALETADREKCSVLYTDSRMVVNAL